MSIASYPAAAMACIRGPLDDGPATHVRMVRSRSSAPGCGYSLISTRGASFSRSTGTARWFSPTTPSALALVGVLFQRQYGRVRLVAWPVAPRRWATRRKSRLALGEYLRLPFRVG